LVQQANENLSRIRDFLDTKIRSSFENFKFARSGPLLITGTWYRTYIFP